MVDALRREGLLRSKEAEEAMLRVPRECFVLDDQKGNAYADRPLPIGKTGQTLSAPHMEAMLLEALELTEGLDVLEIGAGSGYNAALIGTMLGPAGHLTSVELSPDLVELAASNLARADLGIKVRVVEGDGWRGYPPDDRNESYDRVVVTAAAPKVPSILVAQLRKGGLLIAPVGDPAFQDLVRISKSADGTVSSESLAKVVFVPLRGGG